ncbi:MAG: LamG-like jellyroll fold domain-containing protein [Bacteroidota bacterium]
MKMKSPHAYAFALLLSLLSFSGLLLKPLQAQSGYPVIDTTDLVAYYDFYGSFRDSTGKNADAFPSNAELTDDLFCYPENAVHLTAADSYLRIEDDASLDLTDRFSISFWLYLDSVPAAETRIISKSDPAEPAAGSFWISLLPGEEDPSGTPWSFSFTNTEGTVQTCRAEWGMFTGHWIYYTVTFDGSMVMMYLGTEPVIEFAVTPTSMLPNDHPLWIGNSVGSGFTGKLDNMLLYKRVVQVQELESIKNQSLVIRDTERPAITAGIGDEVELVSKHSGPNLIYTFSKDGDILQEGRDSIYLLEIQSVSDSGVYTCTAYNCLSEHTKYFDVELLPFDYYPSLDTTGLRAFYTFHGDYNDSTGNTGPATAHSVVADTGIFGNPNQGVRFSGQDSYLEIPDDPDLDITDQFSISLSLMIDTVPDGMEALLAKPDGSTDTIGNYGLFLDSGLSLLFAITASDGTVYKHVSTSKLQPGVWHLVTVSYNGTEMNSYLDGVPDTPLPVPGLSLRIDDNSLIIGNPGDGIKSFVMDDFRLYARALEEEEIIKFTGLHIPKAMSSQQSTLACPGEVVEFTPIVSGPFLHYTFFREGVVLQEGHTPSYTISISSEEDLGVYRCIVSNGYGTCEVEMSVQPGKLYEGIYIYDVTTTEIFYSEYDQVKLVFYASDNLVGLEYEMYHNGNLMPDASWGLNTIDSAGVEDVGEYYFVVVNGCERIISDTVTLIMQGQEYTSFEAEGWDWTGTISGTGNSYFSSISSGPDGSICVLGHFAGGLKVEEREVFSSLADDIFIVKYSKDGDYQWSQYIVSPNHKGKGDLAVDSDGNVYVSGSYRNSIHIAGQSLTTDKVGGSGYLAKFTSAGALVWIKPVEPTGGVQCDNIEIDAENHIYLGGNFTGSLTIGSFEVTGSWDQYATVMFLARMDREGDCEWISHAVTDADMMIGFGLIDMDLSASGEVVTCGTYTGQADFGNGVVMNPVIEAPFLVKFNEEGMAQWGTNPAFNSGFGEAFDLSVDEQDRIFMTGMFLNDISFGDLSVVSDGSRMEEIFLARFDAGGVCTALNYYGSLGDGWDFGIGYEPASDTTGFLIGMYGDTLIMGADTLIAGEGRDSREMFLAQLTDDGEALSLKPAGIRANSFFGEIHVAHDGRIYFAGLNTGVSMKKATAAGTPNIAFVGYRAWSGTQHVAIENDPVDNDYIVYPNPASQVVFVKSPDRLPFELRIFGISGKSYLHLDDQPEYAVDVSGLIPGIYILKLEREEEISIHKIVVR